MEALLVTPGITETLVSLNANVRLPADAITVANAQAEAIDMIVRHGLAKALASTARLVNRQIITARGNLYQSGPIFKALYAAALRTGN